MGNPRDINLEKLMDFHYPEGMPEIESIAKLTMQNQLTLPASVRKALGVDPGARVRFLIDKDQVRVESVGGSDLVVAAMLAHLEKEMISNPGSISPLTRDLELEGLISGLAPEVD